MIEYCTSCGVKLQEKGFTVFPCPKCGKVEIGRCAKCRKQSNLYTCEECGFVGP
ncbi:RNA-binding protein [ANME-1 cluster archaeon AG-394-G06]|nr:RNA-binding protein [ANME-1 cluster archaeon AG-394-G06]